LGCLKKSVKIRMITITGKISKTPSGTEMLELPFSLIGLRKRARYCAILPPLVGFLLFSSWIGSCNDEVDGTYLPALLSKSMAAARWVRMMKRADLSA
jgi:hypothetical protein